jgi:hypothetical protein
VGGDGRRDGSRPRRQHRLSPHSGRSYEPGRYGGTQFLSTAACGNGSQSNPHNHLGPGGGVGISPITIGNAADSNQDSARRSQHGRGGQCSAADCGYPGAHTPVEHTPGGTRPGRRIHSLGADGQLTEH